MSDLSFRICGSVRMMARSMSGGVLGEETILLSLWLVCCLWRVQCFSDNFSKYRRGKYGYFGLS